MNRLWSWLSRRRTESGPARPDTGAWGEAVAADFLKRQGWSILARRARTDRRNELDLVARADDTLVFVEVKTRASETFGRPMDAVTPAKRRHLSRAAVRYVSRRRIRLPYVRFDVIEVIGRPDAGEAPVIRHIENAFPLAGRYRFPE